MGRARTAVAIAVAAAVGSGAAVTLAALQEDEAREAALVRPAALPTTIAPVDGPALVAKAFDAKRPSLLSACGIAAGAAAGVSFDVTMGADGTLLAWGVNETREAAPGLGDCLRGQPFDLSIDEPLGESVRVELQL